MATRFCAIKLFMFDDSGFVFFANLDFPERTSL